VHSFYLVLATFNHDDATRGLILDNATDETAGKGEQSDGWRQVCLNLSQDQSVSRTGIYTQRRTDTGDGQILNHMSSVGLWRNV